MVGLKGIQLRGTTLANGKDKSMLNTLNKGKELILHIFPIEADEPNLPCYPEIV